MVQDFYSFLATLPTTLRGVQHGHMGLIMWSVLYTILPQTSYTIPEDLEASTNVPTGSTSSGKPDLIGPRGHP